MMGNHCFSNHYCFKNLQLVLFWDHNKKIPSANMPTIKYLYGLYEFFFLFFFFTLIFFPPKKTWWSMFLHPPTPPPLATSNLVVFFISYRETLSKHHEITLFLTRDRHPLSFSTSGQAIFSQNHHHWSLRGVFNTFPLLIWCN